MTAEWDAWRQSASSTRARLSRIIRNTKRFDNATFNNLLSKIDAAIERDKALLRAAIEND